MDAAAADENSSWNNLLGKWTEEELSFIPTKYRLAALTMANLTEDLKLLIAKTRERTHELEMQAETRRFHRD